MEIKENKEEFIQMSDKVLGRVTWNVGFVFIQYLNIGLLDLPLFDWKSLQEIFLRKVYYIPKSSFQFYFKFYFFFFQLFSICSLPYLNSHSFLVNYRTQTFRVRLRNSPSPPLFPRYLSDGIFALLIKVWNHFCTGEYSDTAAQLIQTFEFSFPNSRLPRKRRL